MKFGKVDNPKEIDFTLPPDNPETKKALEKSTSKNPLKVSVGCAKWNKADLKGFYPRGTKDELEYYSRQFNSIELNATFYRIFPESTYEGWYEKTPKNFKFFPKIVQNVSHYSRLSEKAYPTLEQYLKVTTALKEKLGTVFLQLHDNFGPKNFEKVMYFIRWWPKDLPLAIEFRHTDWFNNKEVAEELYEVLETYNIANIIVDTAGRRDLLHMRLTNNEAFIRYVGANHPTDFTRLDDWVDRLEFWVKHGLKHINFFIHQNIEESSPLLSAYFIEKLNSRLGTEIKIPFMQNRLDL